jgi:nucleoside-diphosphate-sugar epimerase
MILITGGTGFIGSHLVATLCAAGEPVRCLVRPRRRTPKLPPAAGIAEADLAGGAGIVEALRGVHTVIHLAGVTKALSAADYYEGNVRATEALVRAVQGRAIRFVHVSSLAAIGPSRGGVPVGEDDAPAPLTHYGKSKLEAERIVRSSLPDAVIVRPPVVYGPRDTDVFQLLKSISRGLVLEIAGGERWLSAIYVADLVQGLLAASRMPAAHGRAYFLTHPKAASWSELASTAAAVMNRRPRVVRIPVAVAQAVGLGAEMWARLTRTPGIVSRDKIREARCEAWVCDYRRAAAELNFQAPTSLADGLARTLAWYKEAGWLTY